MAVTVLTLSPLVHSYIYQSFCLSLISAVVSNVLKPFNYFWFSSEQISKIHRWILEHLKTQAIKALLQGQTAPRTRKGKQLESNKYTQRTFLARD